MPKSRQVSLFRNGRNQAVRIPVEYELPGNAALIHREGDRLVIEPIRKGNLLALLASWDAIEDEFPNFEEGQGPARDVDL